MYKHFSILKSIDKLIAREVCYEIYAVKHI